MRNDELYICMCMYEQLTTIHVRMSVKVDCVHSFCCCVIRQWLLNEKKKFFFLLRLRDYLNNQIIISCSFGTWTVYCLNLVYGRNWSSIVAIARYMSWILRHVCRLRLADRQAYDDSSRSSMRILYPMLISIVDM